MSPSDTAAGPHDPFDADLVVVASVLKGEHHAATLTRTSDGVVFAYDEDYLTVRGPAVASTLPLSAAPRRTTGGAVPPFFAGLLPEGARLAAITRAVKTSADDELSLLVAVGADPVGDVTVVTSTGGAPPAAEASTPVVRSLDDVVFADLFAEATDGETVLTEPALSGIQPKVSAGTISFPVRLDGEEHLLKLEPAAQPGIVHDEAFFLGMARACGLRTPKARVVYDASGAPGLLVARFDRRGSGRGRARVVERLAQEDACQLAGLWPADKYNVTWRTVLDAVAGVVSAPQVAVLELLRQLAFSYVIANGDLHAKNVSVQWVDGLVVPTPAYDLLSTLPYGDQDLALAVEGRKDNLTPTVFVSSGARHDVREKAVLAMLDDVVRRAEPWIARYAETGFSDKQVAHLQRTSAKRIEDLR